MIGKLSGIIDTIEEGHVLLDVGGVGYLVFASARTLRLLGQKGDAASLFIDTHVREDHIHLYGFVDQAEQSWFKLLTSVQGVGAKVGLALLGSSSPEELQIAIMAQDKAMITRADGVGPKLGVRILTELKDKAGGLEIGSSALKMTPQNTPTNTDQDALSALVNLGYAKGDAFSAIMRVKASADNDNDYNVQDLIRLALKELSA